MKTLSIFFQKAVLIAGIACFLTFPSSAQTEDFITAIPGEQLLKNESLIKYEQTVQRRGNVKKISYIHIGSLARSQKDGQLSLRIPGKEKSITAKARNVKYYSEEDYEWIGKTDEDRGTIILLSNKGVKQAHITTPDGVYDIRPAADGLYALHELDTKQDFVGCIDIPEKAGTDEPVKEDKSSANMRMDPCNAQAAPRVLVLYTPAALAAANNDVAAVQNLALMGITQFNTCTFNSDIMSGAVMTLAAVAPLNMTESGSMGTDIETLIANSTATSLRNTHAADLVVLFTDGNYSGGSVRGGAGTISLQNSRAFAIVEIWAAIGNKTFAHEVGHLYGCRHDGHSDTPSYAQAHNISNGLWIVDRTMMSTNTADGSNRLLNFSNPDKSVGGRPTGTADHDNARRIDETHSTVSSFKPNPAGTFNVLMEGPTYVASEGSRTYEMVYKCGTAPYSFSWEYSTDGINYNPTGSNSETLNWYFYQTQTIYLKGTITTGGQSHSVFTMIDVQIPNSNRLAAEALILEDQKLETSPNPAHDIVKIKYHIDKPVRVKLDILDQTGKIIRSMGNDQKLTEPGSHVAEWHTKDVRSGIYLCRLQTGNEVRINRIFVVR